LKLELDDQERGAVSKSLVERTGRLIENAEDTTLPRATKQSALRELAAIKSVLEKTALERMTTVVAKALEPNRPVTAQPTSLALVLLVSLRCCSSLALSLSRL
jgi:hypothetical protein